MQAFIAVADHRSFRDAALNLHRSHSAVSAQIKALEQQAGAKLFRRTTRIVELTAEGKELLASARGALEEVGGTLRALRATERARKAVIRIGSAPSFATMVLPGLIADFERQAPGTRFIIREGTSAALLQMVTEGAVDLAVGSVVAEPELRFERLWIDRLFVLAPAKASADGKTISMADLCKLPLLLSSEATALRQQLQRETYNQGIQLNIRHECISAQTLVAMALAGLGTIILPERLLPDLAPGHVLRKLQLVEPDMSRTIGVIVARGRRPEPLVEHFLALLRKVA